MWRTRSTILIGVLMFVCVGVALLMWSRALFVAMLAGAAGPMSIGYLLWEPLYILRGTPLIAPFAGAAALYLCQSARFKYLAIVPVLIMVASAVYSTTPL